MNGKKKPSAEQVLASMRVANPKPALMAPSTDSARAAASLEANESLIRLHIDSVVPYRRNPRKKVNERYLDIKESIRNAGKVDNLVKVTKRPGEDHYFPASGGNTRVMAMKELYAEGDKRFEYVDFIFTDYKGEADVLARHYIENDLRSDLIFWDKATSLFELKEELEEELGKSLSLREFAEVAKERGIQAGKDVLGSYRFAVESLKDLGDACYALSGIGVRATIQPHYLKLRRLADKFGISEEEFQERIVRFALARAREQYNQSQDFSVEHLCSDLLETTAVAIGQDSNQIRRMLSILEKLPNSTREELEQPDDSLQNAGQLESSNDHQHAVVSATRGDDANVTSDVNGSATNTDAASGSHVSAISSSHTGNSKSSDILFASGLTPGDNTRKQADNPTAALAFIETGSSADQLEPHQPAQEVASASSDQTRDRFLTDLRSFAQTAELADALRFDDALPLWFYVELPVTTQQSVPLDIESQAGGNPYRYLAWWFLANLAGIFDARMRNTLPNECDVAVALADDELWDDAVRNVVGEPLYEDTLGRLISWQADPTNSAGEALHRLLVALRSVRAAFPDRFTNTSDQPKEEA